MKNFAKEVYDEMIMNAVECKEIKEDTRHKKLDDKHIEIWNAVKEMLPKEGKELLIELDRLTSEILTIETQTMYEKGMHDGVEMLKLMHVI